MGRLPVLDAASTRLVLTSPVGALFATTVLKSARNASNASAVAVVDRISTGWSVAKTIVALIVCPPRSVMVVPKCFVVSRSRPVVPAKSHFVILVETIAKFIV